MLDYQVETALIDLITPSLPAGTVVRHAMTPGGDDESVEGFIIKAVVEKVEPTRQPRYIFRATFDYLSLIPANDLTRLQAALDALETALWSRPAHPPASLSAFEVFVVEQNAFDRTDHRITGERRENRREVMVTCIPV